MQLYINSVLLSAARFLLNDGGFLYGSAPQNGAIFFWLLWTNCDYRCEAFLNLYLLEHQIDCEEDRATNNSEHEIRINSYAFGSAAMKRGRVY